MPTIHFSNYRLEQGTTYFLYVGELKNYGLNVYLRESLSRVLNRPFDFIAIVPDIFEQYNYDNLIVINPRAEIDACKYGNNYSCRVSAKDFMTCVSENRQIQSLIRQLLTRQDHLYIYMYESVPEMTLDTIEGVSILGPDSRITHRLNSKTYQYTQLQDTVPMVDFRICDGLDDAVAAADGLWDQWTDGIFVTSQYSAAGINSVVAHSTEDIRRKFTGTDDQYLMTRYTPHTHDPTVLAVVANEEQVYIAGIADQCIVDGNRFTGSTYPTVLPEDITDRLRDTTRTVGKWLGAEGYRGIFGCDYLVTADGDIRFLEINARKQGTTLEFCTMLEQSLPDGAPTLPELEYFAVTEEVLPINAVELHTNPRGLHWGTFNYKLDKSVRTGGYIPQSSMEREAFGKVASGKLKKDFLILEHIGSDFVVAGGSFLARIVALGHDHESVLQGLEQGRKTIDLTISEFQ